MTVKTAIRFGVCVVSLVGFATSSAWADIQPIGDPIAGPSGGQQYLLSGPPRGAGNDPVPQISSGEPLVSPPFHAAYPSGWAPPGAPPFITPEPAVADDQPDWVEVLDPAPWLAPGPTVPNGPASGGPPLAGDPLRGGDYTGITWPGGYKGGLDGLLGTDDFQVSNHIPPTVVIPVPAAVLLGGVGLGLISALRRRLR